MAPHWPPPNEVQLWRWDLDAPGAGGEADRAILSAAEQARADRFIVAQGTRRYTAGRAQMRRVLAAATGLSPAGLPLAAGDNGKPFLPGGPEFNLSHSGDAALFALAAFPVGVDVERCRPVQKGVAELVFTPAEQAEWAASGWAEAAFYRRWTRKEAVLKALGGSLAQITSLEVSLGNPGVVRGEPAWQVVDVPAGDGYAAAVAAPCRGWRVRWADSRQA